MYTAPLPLHRPTAQHVPTGTSAQPIVWHPVQGGDQFVRFGMGFSAEVLAAEMMMHLQKPEASIQPVPLTKDFATHLQLISHPELKEQAQKVLSDAIAARPASQRIVFVLNLLTIQQGLKTEPATQEARGFLLKELGLLIQAPETDRLSLVGLARRVKDSSLTIGLDNEMALLKKLGTLTVENPAMNESLLAAFKERNLVTMSTALLAGANPNLAALKHWEQSNQHAKTVFLQAARNGDNEALSLLLQAGANPNLPDDFGRTALMQLNGPDFASCTSTLLYAGANLEVQDRYGQTPLLYQAKAANPLGVKNFLVQGANVNHLSREHDSALSLVFNRQELDSAAMECTQRLLDAGIQVRQADAKGAVFQKALYLLAADPSSQWVDRFLAAGADPNGKVPIGLSFLTAAIYWCKPAAEKLIKAGATPNFFSEKDDPFTAAIKEEQPEILKALLTAKPDYIAFLNQEKAEGLGIMNRNNSYRYIQHGEVLSHLARQKPTPEALACLKLLLESGLNPNLLDKDGQTALQVAKRLKNEPALTILEAAGGKSRHSGLERFNLKRLFARRTRVMPTPQKPKADPAKAALTGPPAEAPRPADTPTGERKQDA